MQTTTLFSHIAKYNYVEGTTKALRDAIKTVQSVHV